MKDNHNGISIKITIQGKFLQDLRLEELREYAIGRSEDCFITLNSGSISRTHAKLLLSAEGAKLQDNDSSNGTTLNGASLLAGQWYPVNSGDRICFGGLVEFLVTSLEQNMNQSGSPNRQVDSTGSESSLLSILNAKNQVVIGRHSSCDWVLPSLLASREHAVISKRDGKFYIKDLNSTNGTYVNGQLIDEAVLIEPEDQVTIGGETFSIGQGSIEQKFAIIAENIEKVYPNGYVGLNKINIKIPSRNFVALMGPSGCGKSTLLKALNGVSPVTSGAITIQGLQLNNKNFNILKKHIGYVPQEDIVHGELTVEKTLFYAAKLRMSSDVSNSEINAKIDAVLKSLNLANAGIKENKVSELSGGQRKRVCIAVELLNDPKILFLDEPTSPLDPETIDDFLSCIRGLVKNGQTVVMVTHKPSDLDYVDDIIFLSKGGYQTYYGTKDDMISYFGTRNLIEIYSLLKNPEEGKKWFHRWSTANPSDDQKADHEELHPQPKTSLLRQYYWLSRRYFSIKRSDLWNLALLVGQPIIIGALIAFIFDQLNISVLFFMSIFAIWFGVSNASKEISNELPIYERERMYNLNIGNYIASKMSILAIIALLQVVIFSGIIFLRYQGETVELWEFFPNLGFMFFLSLSATIFGLLLSSVFSNTEKVMTFVPIALMPQFLLAGFVSPLDNTVKVVMSYFMLGRWGTEGFAWIQDYSAEDRGEWADLDKTEPASVMQDLPELVQPTSVSEAPSLELVSKPSGAIEQLDLYRSDDLLTSLGPEGLYFAIGAIMVINILSLCWIYLALKSKDKKFIG